ncbi:YcaO-like family protein [Asticcacaulis sp.]|uniref:YcaO-like family protein n=1 Tax=Asticcacaulis sp. TaxID=1872648 RepID=UPI002636DDD1|nr:YcaO-like family protein [Asticcacaulis sp.]
MLEAVIDILKQNNCVGVAEALPIKKARLNENTLGFYIASVELGADEFCPRGVFGTAFAADIDPMSALTRATFEAVERYFLAASGYSDWKTTFCDISDHKLFKYQSGSCSGYHYSNIVRAVIADNHLTGEKIFVPEGDMFAPYPEKNGNIGAPSTTNGIACHTDSKMAIRSAIFELYERHCIMDFWFIGQDFAKKIPCSYIRNINIKEFSIIESMGYSLTFVLISRCFFSPTILVLARHNINTYPYAIFSASTKSTYIDAITSALKELIQTIVSLVYSKDKFIKWQNIRRVTSLEHNMFHYADPYLANTSGDLFEFIEKIDDIDMDSISNAFSNSEIEPKVADMDPFFDIGLSKTYALEITPKIFRDEICVIRAVNDSAFKLVVGDTFGETRLLRSSTRIKHPHPFP